MLRVKPITYKAACAYINAHHRHHASPQGWKIGISAHDGDRLVGVAIIGRPVARGNDDGLTAEVTRLCTDGTKNVCSFLYGACRRIAKELGYKKIITYILAEEPGTSLKASGWRQTGRVKGRSWDTPSRPRSDKHPTVDKTRWECSL